MKMRLQMPRFLTGPRRAEAPVPTKHPAPPSAMRVLGTRPTEPAPEPPGPAPRAPDHSGWYRCDAAEGFRLLDGYRWGTAAAQVACDFDDPPAPDLDPAWARRLRPGPTAAGGLLPALRDDAVLARVASRTDALVDAVERIETRVDELDERFVDVVHHADLVEGESRRAKLAAEVSRLSVELKAELDRRLTELARAVARSNERSATIDHRGPLDLADARRAEIIVEHLTEQTKVTDISEARTAS